ncbi:DUF2255 family protein [Humibacillus xanthopallidus]|uniref:DUF2255 family protein n=1 Tax=Humibacillus xanthopallidus TaxID=412689 RepID=A0A543HI08_9MICO|nr:DUF2255 family protein [Humibacillus xanthopallidus]TQM57954.1 hypothetical protein FBY41_3306 [Humibacillus xanthopallidus]
MSRWDPDRLAVVDADEEMTVAAHRPDGTLRTPRIVWQVIVDNGLWIRSVRGASGGWYRGVRRTGTGRIEAGGATIDVTFTPDQSHDDAIDRAYREKYGNGSAVRAITSPLARATTLRVEPA